MAVVDSLWVTMTSPKSPVDHIALGAISEVLLLLLLFLVLAPLLRSLFHLFTTTLTSSSTQEKLSSSSSILSALPNLPSTIPYLGHLLGLQSDSTRYINTLLASSPADLFTIDIPFKRIILARPAMDRALSRHVSDTGLAQILAHVGTRVFGLGQETIRVILDADPRPLHKVEFGGVENLAMLSETSGVFVWDEMSKVGEGERVPLARWMFRLTVSATASAVWGVENPWRMDDEFAEEFMNLSETFDSLSRPFPRITAPSAYASRAFLSSRLASFHHAHRPARVLTVAHAINVVAHSDPDWESNPDYFNIEMVSALGLLATPSTLSVWLVRHLLASPETLERVVAEVDALADVRGQATGLPRLDLSDIRVRCPWLVAAWYETLRLHMTGVPRLARHDFTLNTSPTTPPLSVSQGDIFLLPMCASNLDVSLWGPDAASFHPGRFIQTSDGGLNNALIRKVRAFGVAGNLCPGRVFGFEVAMMVVAGLLRDFEVRGVEEEKEFVVPPVRRGFNVGFERYADDVDVKLVRRR